MYRGTLKQWINDVGPFRAWLLLTALLGYVALHVLRPPWFVSSKPLILPFSYLVTLDILSAVLFAVAMVECLNILDHRWTKSWKTKQYFTAGFVFFAVSIVSQTVCVRQTSGRYYDYGWAVADKENYPEAKRILDLALS